VAAPAQGAEVGEEGYSGFEDESVGEYGRGEQAAAGWKGREAEEGGLRNILI
jgi:hypothetical protein